MPKINERTYLGGRGSTAHGDKGRVREHSLFEVKVLSFSRKNFRDF